MRNVWLMNPDGSNPRQVTTELAPVTAYDVTSDGRSIVYAAGGAVRAMRLDTGAVTTLTAADQFGYAPVLAPGGEQVLLGRRDAVGADLGYWLVPMPDAGEQTARSCPTARPHSDRQPPAVTGSMPGRTSPPGQAGPRSIRPG